MTGELLAAVPGQRFGQLTRQLLRLTDDAGTLTALKKLRTELIDPTIAAYRGRMVKLMGVVALTLGLAT